MEQGGYSVRVTSNATAGARVYVRKNQFDVGLPLTFDSDYPHITALEYLLGAIAGGLVSGLTDLARRRRITICQVEAVIQAGLRNPLTHLGVIGESGDPGIEAISVKLFVDTPAEENAVRALWDEVLQRSPLWHTFRTLVRFDLQLELT